MEIIAAQWATILGKLFYFVLAAVMLFVKALCMQFESSSPLKIRRKILTSATAAYLMILRHWARYKTFSLFLLYTHLHRHESKNNCSHLRRIRGIFNITIRWPTRNGRVRPYVMKWS